MVSFYDVTTLYFESESEDDLRRIGFSKEGKLNRPQIELGLLTTLEGYPISYEVYEGNRFEGHTLIDSLEKFQKRFKLNHKPIVVADRGMLNSCNLIELDKKCNFHKLNFWVSKCTSQEGCFLRLFSLLSGIFERELIISKFLTIQCALC